jgi:RNA polymerase sigma-70 factor, ECF subfamily
MGPPISTLGEAPANDPHTADLHGRVRPVVPASASEGLASVMLRVSQGDQSAFGEFYDSTSRSVYGIVLRVLRDPAQAEEVAQEVYLEAWRSAQRYDAAQGSPAAWINTIAHRRAVDRVRAVERSAERDHRHALEESGQMAPDVSDVVVARNEGDRVRRALALLPEPQRVALALAYFDGCTQREVADILNVPLGTVKTRTRDALRKLRGQLERGRDD